MTISGRIDRIVMSKYIHSTGFYLSIRRKIETLLFLLRLTFLLLLLQIEMLKFICTFTIFFIMLSIFSMNEVESRAASPVRRTNFSLIIKVNRLILFSI